MARALFIHRLGEIRDRIYENQQHWASGLNLLVAAIILWNTRYLERAVATLRQTENVPDHLLSHLSPLGWEHVNLTGDYVWGTPSSASENNDGLRPLRTPPEAYARAADVRASSAYASPRAQFVNSARVETTTPAEARGEVGGCSGAAGLPLANLAH